MARGIVRKLDELGRVSVPTEARRAAGISVLEPLDLIVINKVLHLKAGKGRCIDKQGRYCIPKEIRRSNKWADDQALDIYVENGEICIRKNGEECGLCGSDSHLIKVDDNHVCMVCLRKANLAAKEIAYGCPGI